MKPNLIALLAEMFYKCEVEDTQGQVVDDVKLRSQSCADYSASIDAGIKQDVKKDLENHRSSSAPMLASEIISARCPAVGKKLMDFTKEKNKQKSSTAASAFERKNQEQNSSPRRAPEVKRE